jgi:hypothetical protein
LIAIEYREALREVIDGDIEAWLGSDQLRVGLIGTRLFRLPADRKSPALQPFVKPPWRPPPHVISSRERDSCARTKT